MSPTKTATDSDAVRMLAEHAGNSASGILTVTSGKLKRLFCLDQGRLVFAASNLIEEQFPEALVKANLLSPAHRAEAKVEAARKQQKLATYLHEEEVVSPDILMSALEDHVRTLLSASLEAPDGHPSFARGRPDLDGELLVDLSCVPIVLDHVRTRPASIDDVRVRIGPPNIKPRHSEGAEKLLAGVTLDEAATHVLEHSNGERDVSALVDRPSGPDGDRLRALYGLMLLGILEGAEKIEETTTDQGVTENEALGRLRTAESATCYEILGVDRNAKDNEIRESYYYLARRYHPDRFRTGPLARLLDEIEQYFTKVTEAYNTLIDPERRSQYNEELTARLGGEKKPELDHATLARQNFARAKALLARNRLHEALTFLENAVNLDDSRAPYHLELAKVLSRNPRRRADAETHFQRANEIDPTSADGYFELGQFYARSGRTDDAKRLFREALRWDQQHRGARAQLDALGKGKGRGGLFGG